MMSIPPFPRRLASVAAALAAVLVLATPGCRDDDGPTAPDGSRLFRVRAGADEFRMRVTDPEAIRLALENIEGRNNKHPHGRIALGNGGVNAPWTWHFLPDTVRMVDTSIELCDGAPSYVESHRVEYLLSGYCPWGARIVAVE